jgi:hypothetical protein
MGDIQSRWDSTADELARTRRVLVREALEVFAVAPSTSSQGEYEIGGVVLPSPGDVGRHEPERIDAAVSHTAHCVRLIALYLGVKLPFMVFTGPNPSIRATADSAWSHK